MHVEKEFQKNINHKGSPETRSLKLLGYRLRFFRDINLYGMCFMRFRLRPLLHSPFSTPPAFPACFLNLAEPNHRSALIQLRLPKKSCSGPLTRCVGSGYLLKMLSVSLYPYCTTITPGPCSRCCSPIQEYLFPLRSKRSA